MAMFVTGLTMTTFASVGGGSSDRRGNSTKAVDQLFERGKAVYQGRAQGVSKINYCIDNGTSKVKLKSKTAKSFRNTKANDFALALYDCNDTNTAVHTQLSRENLSLLIYYFNKRYRLNLAGL